MKSFKIVIIGETGTGKTSIINKYIKNTYNKSIYSTIGVDFFEKILIHSNITYNLQIWDLSGIDRFHSIIRTYYVNTNAVILTYDTNNIKSLYGLNKWINDINNIYQDSQSLDIIRHNRPIFILVGTKIDKNNTKINTNIIQKFIKDNHIDLSIECSSKYNQNINEIFDILLNNMIQNQSNNSNNSIDSINNSNNSSNKTCSFCSSCSTCYII